MTRSVKLALKKADSRRPGNERGGGIHSSNYTSKVALRRWLCSEVDSPLRVLETHAGPGAMRSLCYDGADEVLSCDVNPAAPDAIHCDSRLLLRQASLDLSRFNLFDVDPFGSPFEHLFLIGRRIVPTRKIGIMITCGSLGRRTRMMPTMGRASTGVMHVLDELGIGKDEPTTKWTGADGGRLLLARAVATWFPLFSVDSWRSDASAGQGFGIRYDAVVLTPQRSAEAPTT